MIIKQKFKLITLATAGPVEKMSCTFFKDQPDTQQLNPNFLPPINPATLLPTLELFASSQTCHATFFHASMHLCTLFFLPAKPHPSLFPSPNCSSGGPVSPYQDVTGYSTVSILKGTLNIPLQNLQPLNPSLLNYLLCMPTSFNGL